MLLTFYRGWWCPKEQAFFRQLVRFQDEVEVAYTRMVSVSVDSPEVESAFRAGLGARWTFLSDAERLYLDEPELRETTDTSHNPYMRAAFVLRPDLEIASAYAGYWFWGRPTLAGLHRDLRRGDARGPRPVAASGVNGTRIALVDEDRPPEGAFATARVREGGSLATWNDEGAAPRSPGRSTAFLDGLRGRCGGYHPPRDRRKG